MNNTWTALVTDYRYNHALFTSTGLQQFQDDMNKLEQVWQIVKPANTDVTLQSLAIKVA